ncbi:MAG: GIY-YIG nuclease family protein [bacterium]|nr:GIY-YIG nuclease family protein [bacterium]
MKFYYVYVLKSLSSEFIYIGFTENLKQRFNEHNSGKSKSTKPYVPYDLIHYEAYRNIKDAKRREEYLKSNRGKTTLITMLKEYFGEN